jgi:hypothetical protein
MKNAIANFNKNEKDKIYKMIKRVSSIIREKLDF